MKSLGLCACCLFFALLAFPAVGQSAPPSFSEADVAKFEAKIKLDYINKGFEVMQVGLVKDSDRRLVGFVKYRNQRGLVRPEITRNCVVLMDAADPKRSISECK